VGAWLASEGGLKGGAEFETAIASKPAPTGEVEEFSICGATPDL